MEAKVNVEKTSGLGIEKYFGALLKRYPCKLCGGIIGLTLPQNDYSNSKILQFSCHGEYQVHILDTLKLKSYQSAEEDLKFFTSIIPFQSTDGYEVEYTMEDVREIIDRYGSLAAMTVGTPAMKVSKNGSWVFSKRDGIVITAGADRYFAGPASEIVRNQDAADAAAAALYNTSPSPKWREWDWKYRQGNSSADAKPKKKPKIDPYVDGGERIIEL